MFSNYDRNLETLMEMFDEIAHPHKKRHTHMGFFSDELIQMDLATEEYMWDEMKKEKAELTSEVEQLTSEKEKLTSEKEKLTSENMDLATQNAHLTSKIDDLEKELVSLRKLLSGNS